MAQGRGRGSHGFHEQSTIRFANRSGAAARRDRFAGVAEIVRMQPKREADAPATCAILRQRFLELGPAGILDHEMLELLLSRAVPRSQLRPLVDRLIATFGDYNGVISAAPVRLSRVDGVDPDVICELKLIEAAAHRLARSRIINRHALSHWADLMDYCKTTMAHRQVEHFRILFLDRKNVLVADEEQGRGTVDHVPVYPREVVKRALELNASAIILVHNHPSGDPTPSAADVEMTRQIQRATTPLGIIVHDHVIVGRENDVSFRSKGLL